MNLDQRIDLAADQAQRILNSSIATIDARFTLGYAKKNPGVLSNLISLQIALIQNPVKS